jgi:hypothetical protein
VQRCIWRLLGHIVNLRSMNETKIMIPRLYHDEHGIAHFDDLDIIATSVDFAPPAPRVFATAPAEARRHLFLTLPSGWFGKEHPAPSRQMMTILNGTLEVQASDGTVRVFKTGDTVLVEDTEGRGHSTKSLSDKPVTLSVTQL